MSSPTIGPSSGVSSHLIRDVKIVAAGTVPYAQRRNCLNVCAVIVTAVLLSSDCFVSRDELKDVGKELCILMALLVA